MLEMKKTNYEVYLLIYSELIKELEDLFDSIYNTIDELEEKEEKTQEEFFDMNLLKSFMDRLINDDKF